MEHSLGQHLDELRASDAGHYELVQRVRQQVRAVAPDVSETVIYGGIIFAAPIQFCGVFAYREHVSVEFSRGYELRDTHRVLEGSGKLRRHIKLRAEGDLESKHVSDYIAQAYANALPQ